MAAGPCGCGRTSRVLAELEGRVGEVVRFADGGFVVASVVESVVTKPEEVRAYQLVQRAIDRFELRLATVDEAFARISPAICSELSAVLGGAKVTAVEVAEIERGAGGKYQRIVPWP